MSDDEVEMSNPRDEVISAIVRKYKTHPLVEQAIHDRKSSYYAPGCTDPIADYLGEAHTYRLLSVEDVAELFPKIERGYRLYSELGGFSASGVITPEYETAFIDLTIAQQVVYVANLRLVFSVAKSYMNYTSGGMEAFDHVLEGQEGLVKAINRFDASRGFKFSTYATNWIRQSITRAIGDKSRTIRLPIHKHDQWVKARVKVGEYGKYLGRDMTPKEIETATGMNYDKYQELMHIGAQNQPSLEAILPHTEDLNLGMLLGHDHVNETIDAFSDREQLVDIINHSYLLDRERFIIGLRYGVDPALLNNPSVEVNGKDISYAEVYAAMTKAAGLTLDDLGSILSLTRERIRQLEKRSLKSMQEAAVRLNEEF